MIIIVFEEIHKKTKKMKLQKVASNLAKSKYSAARRLPPQTHKAVFKK